MVLVRFYGSELGSHSHCLKTACLVAVVAGLTDLECFKIQSKNPSIHSLEGPGLRMNRECTGGDKFCSPSLPPGPAYLV